MSVLTLFIAILTLGVVVFTALQISSYLETVQIENRAYLIVYDVHLRKPLEVNNWVYVDWNIKNIGKTPAHNVRWCAIVDTGEVSIKNISTVDTISAYTGLVYGSEVPYVAPRTDMQWELRPNCSKVYIIGNLAYNDRFGRAHYTRFLYILGDNTHADSVHNDAD
jgi:hypothetical protein